MLIIERNDNETIDRVLRRYKRKHRETKLRQELQNRKYFTKPSVKRRKEILKAIFIEEKQQDNLG